MTKRCFLSISDALNLITHADNNGQVFFECRGLPPMAIIIPNIQEVRNILEKEARRNDELKVIMERMCKSE